MPYIKNIHFLAVIFLFIVISLIPQPIQKQWGIGTNIFLLAAFVSILFKKGTSIFKKSDASLWFFVVAIGINVFFANQKNISLVTYLDLAIRMFCIYYLVSESVTTNERFLILAKVISFSSILVAILGLMDVLLGFNFIYEFFIYNIFYREYRLRAISTQFHSPPLGTYLIVSLPFNFLLARQDKGLMKIIGFIGVFLCIIVTILTQSRGAFLTLFIVFLSVLLFNREYILMCRVIYIFIAFVLFFSGLPVKNRFYIFGIGGIFLHQTSILGFYRIMRFIMSFKMLKDYPLTGLGLQNFRIMFEKYSPYTLNEKVLPFIAKPSYEFKIADNMYLTLLAEAGLLGICGLLFFLFSIFKKAWEKIALLRFVPKERMQLLMVLAAIIGVLVHMGAYELFYWRNQYVFFCILVGLIEAFHRNL